MLLDGELVCLGADGSPDFASLRRRLRAPAERAARRAEHTPATFLAFDLLHLDGRSTRELPYERRHELLLDLALDDGLAWRAPRHFVSDSERVLAATRERGLEGVVAKRLGSPYLPGARNGAWVKHKHRRTESFLVTGWSPAELRRPESLLLARVGPDGALEPAGSVPLALGNGRADDVQRHLEPLVLPLTRRGQHIRRLAPALQGVVAFHGPSAGPFVTRSSARSARSSRPARGSRCSHSGGDRTFERASAAVADAGSQCMGRPCSVDHCQRALSSCARQRGRVPPAGPMR